MNPWLINDQKWGRILTRPYHNITSVLGLCTMTKYTNKGTINILTTVWWKGRSGARQARKLKDLLSLRPQPHVSNTVLGVPDFTISKTECFKTGSAKTPRKEGLEILESINTRYLIIMKRGQETTEVERSMIKYRHLKVSDSLFTRNLHTRLPVWDKNRRTRRLVQDQRYRCLTRDDYKLSHMRHELRLLSTQTPRTRAQKLESPDCKHPPLTFRRRGVLNAQEKQLKHIPTRSRADDTPFAMIFLWRKNFPVFVQ